MTKLEQIERAIEELSPGEIATLREWLEELDARLFDQKIEHDAASGKLDLLMAKRARTTKLGGGKSSEPRQAMRHFKDPRFRPPYDALPANVRAQADKNFALLKQNPKHPSCIFKRVRDDLWSVRVARSYRALATESEDGFQWFWIGTHAEYDRLVG